MIEFKFYLYTKESPLNLKYLGITEKNPYTYMGSGKYWKRHLKAYGFIEKDIKTTILVKVRTEEELKVLGLYFSELYNIVESEEWANLKPESGYSSYGYKHSKEILEKISKKVKEAFKNGSPLKGRKYSKEWKEKQVRKPFIRRNLIITNETRLKISNALTGKKLSDNHKLNLSKSHIGKEAKNKRPIIQYDLEMNFIRKYNSIFEAVSINNYKGEGNICNCCKGKLKKCYGYIWKYDG